MKAWILSVLNNDGEQNLVFADTASQAKKQANIDGGRLYNFDLNVENYAGIRANRASQFDDMENEPEFEMVILLLQNGWWFTINEIMYTEDDLSEFKEKFKNWEKWEVGENAKR